MVRDCLKKHREGILFTKKLCCPYTLLSLKPQIYKAEALEAKLNVEEKELFEKFCNAQDDEGHLYQVETFIRGFRIAD